MKRFLSTLVMCALCATLTWATPQPQVVPVKTTHHQRHRAQRHHAHKAARHRAPKHRGTV